MVDFFYFFQDYIIIVASDEWSNLYCSSIYGRDLMLQYKTASHSTSLRDAHPAGSQ